jgi:hypothetical protein
VILDDWISEPSKILLVSPTVAHRSVASLAPTALLLPFWLLLARAHPVRLAGMRKRALKILVFVLLGWYLAGPLFESVDVWDSPREESKDITRSAGGYVTLVAAVVCFGIVLLQRLRDRCRCVSTTVFRFALLSASRQLNFSLLESPLATASPPLPLRI